VTPGIFRVAISVPSPVTRCRHSSAETICDHTDDGDIANATTTLMARCVSPATTRSRAQQQKAVQKRKERAEGRKDRGKARKGLSEKPIKNRRTTLHTILVYAVKRHSFGSILTTGGAPLRIVQSLLGHSSIRATERYAHLAPGQSAAFAHLGEGDRCCSCKVAARAFMTGTGPADRPSRKQSEGRIRAPAPLSADPL
jgi:hypothetical protein